MTIAHRISNLVGVVVPLLAVLVAIVLLWNTLVDWSDLVVLGVMYVTSGLGITVGFHRMLTHRSFATYKPVQYFYAIVGSTAVHRHPGCVRLRDRRHARGRADRRPVGRRGADLRAHHVTWSINSVCHFFGSRRFEVEDHSTNVFWLAPLSFGSPGTTTTTPSRARRCTACAGGRSTRRHG